MQASIKLLLVIGIGLLLSGVARRGIRSLATRNLLSPQIAAIGASIIKWVFLIAVSLVGLNILGISVTSLWASLSAILMLVAIGFVAVWSVLSNASCALFLVVFAPFRIGDEIEILEPAALDPDKPGIRGRVADISFLYTTLVRGGEEEQEVIQVPNNQFFQKAIRCRRGSGTRSLKQALFEKSAAGSREDS
jgi:small-conductance mechanosensitive channel